MLLWLDLAEPSTAHWWANLIKISSGLFSAPAAYNKDVEMLLEGGSRNFGTRKRNEPPSTSAAACRFPSFPFGAGDEIRKHFSLGEPCAVCRALGLATFSWRSTAETGQLSAHSVDTKSTGIRTPTGRRFKEDQKDVSQKIKRKFCFWPFDLTGTFGSGRQHCGEDDVFFNVEETLGIADVSAVVD